MSEKDYLDSQDDFDDVSGDDSIASIEIPKEVRHLRTQSYDKSLSDLVGMIDRKSICLDPDYQRNYLWDNNRASLLIESILLNIPIPVIYVEEDEEKDWNVIDGLQRLTSINRFFKNDFKLTRLEVLTELNGQTYSNLQPKARRILENGMLRVVVLLEETHPEIKYDVFMRLNNGAVKLNEQELRNCLYRGKLNEVIKELRENKEFLLCLGLKEPHKRFVDAEMILRFFALYYAYDIHEKKLIDYPGKMKTFLNEFMAKHRKMSPKEADKFKALFDKSVEGLFSTFGKNAFKRINKDGKYEIRINRSLVDVIMICFAHLSKEKLIKNKDLYIRNIKELCSNDDFLETITMGTSDFKKVELRLTLGLEKFGIITK